MTIDKTFLVNALLQHNFLPAQKRDKDELPPIVTSKGFSEALANKIAILSQKRKDPYAGYDAVQYKLTRFNGVTRVCSIPHPKAYAALVLSIADNWGKFEYILNNPASIVFPQKHADGRLINMEYESSAEEADRKLSSSFGRRYLVETDISNCFPSIYSHSIPWALVGTSEAKRNIRNGSKWYNQLDRAVRWTKRNESTGVLVGPGTSDVLAEAILARVDEALKGTFAYTRYVDDYTAFCEGRLQAEQFVISLSNELAKFSLGLNAGKTRISEMPQSATDDWVVGLKRAIPNKGTVSVHAALDFLDYMVSLAERTPDGSVLKYGLKSLMSNILDASAPANTDTLELVLKYGLNLSFHCAILVPLLERLLDEKLSRGGGVPVNEIQALLLEHTRFRRSDAVSWLLYYAVKYNIPVPDECACKVLETGDCIPILLLYQTRRPNHKRWVTDFAKKLDPKDLYRLDQYWLLLYELFRGKKIDNPYGTGPSGDGVFEEMVSAKVKFVDTIPVTT